MNLLSRSSVQRKNRPGFNSPVFIGAGVAAGVLLACAACSAIAVLKDASAPSGWIPAVTPVTSLTFILLPNLLP